MKKTIFVLIMAILVMSVGCEKKLNYEDAKDELKKHCGKFPTTFGITSDENIYKYDVTGDGYDDLSSYVFFGSGMPRTDVVVYDVYNEKFYSLDAFEVRGRYGYSYRIIGIEENIMIIEEEHFTVENKKPVFGRITFNDGVLGFEPFDKNSHENELAEKCYENYLERLNEIYGF